MNINLVCPVNQLGYGVTGLNTLQALVARGHNVTWFPIGSIVVEPDRNDISELLAKVYFRDKDYDSSAPSYRMFHEFDSVMHPVTTGPKITQVVFELDEISPRSVHLLNQLDGVAVPTAWAYDMLRKCGVSKPIHVIPHGVDGEIFKSADPIGSPVSAANPFTFLCVGKWEKRKAQEEVAQAFMQEFHDDEPVHLKFMCDNPFLPSEKMEEIKETYQEPGRITFLSWAAKQSSVAMTMQQADCGVFCSRAEGWNMPLSEMIACNRPVVATNKTGHTHYLDSQNHYSVESGDLVKAHDEYFFRGEADWYDVFPQEIQKGLRKAFEKGRVGNAGCDKIVERFPWSNTAAAIERFIWELKHPEGNKIDNPWTT